MLNLERELEMQLAVEAQVDGSRILRDLAIEEWKEGFRKSYGNWCSRLPGSGSSRLRRRRRTMVRFFWPDAVGVGGAENNQESRVLGFYCRAFRISWPILQSY